MYRQGMENFSFSQPYRSGINAPTYLFSKYLGFISWINWPESKADHALESSAKTKNMWSYMKWKANWCHYFNVFYLYVFKSLHVSALCPILRRFTQLLTQPLVQYPYRSGLVLCTWPERYGYWVVSTAVWLSWGWASGPEKCRDLKTYKWNKLK
jgi:hypothetical protein